MFRQGVRPIAEPDNNRVIINACESSPYRLATNVKLRDNYSQALSMGFDPEAPNKSQGYINEVATRALIFIEADEPTIGLMCFMAVGMAEVSTCEITVYEGQHITKGQEIGMFHFGGSTYCLIFRPEVSLEFDLHGQTPGLDSNNIPINSRIATVK